MKLTLSAPDISEREIDAVTSVLRSGRLSLGPWMERFEGSVAGYVGVPFGIAVSSGTAGLHLCLVAMGIGPGDEVIVPSFAFIAAANAIRYVGATPVFVDIDPVSLNMDPDRVREAVTARTRALMVVHTFGRPAAMDALLAIAREHGLRVLEDACEALGATFDGQPVGSFGDAAVFAFYPNKQITTGEGGVVVTHDERLAREIRALRNQGRYPGDEWHQHSLLGYNYRLSEMQCALGAVQMSRLPEILAQRRRVAALYTQAFAGEPRVQPLAPAGPREHISWFVYVVRLHLEAVPSTRDEVAGQMQRAGIPTGRYFAPIHEQPAYAQYPGDAPLAPVPALPVTVAESRRTLALPFYNALQPSEIEYVAKSLRDALGGKPVP